MRSEIVLSITEDGEDGVSLASLLDFGDGAEFAGDGSFGEIRSVGAGGEDSVVLSEACPDATSVRVLMVENVSDTPMIVYGIPSAAYSEHTPMVVGPTPLDCQARLLLTSPVTGYRVGPGGLERITVRNQSASAGSYRIYMVFASA